MTEETDDRKPFPIATVAKYGFGMIVMLALFGGWAKFYPFDTDGDGEPNKTDDCVATAGVASAKVGAQTFAGCPDPDPDKDGFYVAIPGGLQRGLIETAVDQCPDERGTDIALSGCPTPTPEERAMAAWKELEVGCTELYSNLCYNAEAKLSVLPAEEQTEARKAKALEAEQIVLEERIKPGYSGVQVYDIAAVQDMLSRVTNTEHAAALRKQVAQALWVAYYYDCNPQTQVCYEEGVKEHQMTRSDAATKIFAFYPSEAYNKPVDLAMEVFQKVEYSELEARAVMAAYENDPPVAEADLATAFGVELKDLTIAGCSHEAMFRQALAYGWFRPQAEKCVGMYMEEYKFQRGITFARKVGMEEAAQRIEAEAMKVSLKHGRYSVTDGGQRVIEIADLEDLKGS